MNKENLHFDDQSKQVFLFFLHHGIFSKFLSSHRHIHESLGELIKAVKIIA